MLMSTLRRMVPRSSPLAILVALLVTTFVLTCVMADQARRATRAERVRADATAKIFASIAAANWKDKGQTYVANSVYAGFRRALETMSVAGRPVGLDELTQLVDEEGFCKCDPIRDIHYYFSLDAATLRLSTARGEPDSATRQWLLDRLPRATVLHMGLTGGIGLLTDWIGARRHLVLFAATGPSTRPDRFFGFEADTTVLTKMLNSVLDLAPLLPESIAVGIPNRTSVGVAIEDSSGRTIYRSPADPGGPYTASASLESIPAGSRVRVTIDPATADQLIGGFPVSRKLLLLAMLILTGGLTVIALFLIRREAEVARLRADFISSVSHELRTPLAQIRMFTETLLLGRVRSELERRRSLEIIDQESKRLAHLVENVLLFARSERMGTRIVPEVTDFSGQVRDVVDSFSLLARSRNVQFRVELQERVVAPVDRDALRQILLNLLDNAVKYGPAGQRVTVGMALFGDAVRVWVDDEGPGIPANRRARVFDSFFRLGRDVDSPVAGSGIGLAVVRELTGLHDGRAWAEDAPGGGARVVAEFPGAYVRKEMEADAGAETVAVA